MAIIGHSEKFVARSNDASLQDAWRLVVSRNKRRGEWFADVTGGTLDGAEGIFVAFLTTCREIYEAVCR